MPEPDAAHKVLGDRNAFLHETLHSVPHVEILTVLTDNGIQPQQLSV